LLIGVAEVIRQLELCWPERRIAALYGLQIDEGFSEKSFSVYFDLSHGEVLPVAVFADDAQSQKAGHLVLASEKLLSAVVFGSGREQPKPGAFRTVLHFLEVERPL
jgi:hypothetical protein